MRITILALLLSAPLAAAQTQYVTHDINETLDLPSDFGPTIQQPLIPGELVDISWDLLIEVNSYATVTNNTPEDRVFTARIYYTWLRNTLTLSGSELLGSVTMTSSGVVAPGESQLVFTGESFVLSGGRANPYGGLPEQLQVVSMIDNPPGAPYNWTWCVPGASTGCPGTWGSDGVNVLNEPGATATITGTITWTWEPYITSAVEICEGDGYQELVMFGDWQGDVRAYSNYVGNFTMLFLGQLHQSPGQSFCIGAGQRINESLMAGRMDYEFAPGTLIAGQTYTLQAVHRWGVGEVRFSNAILFQPL